MSGKRSQKPKDGQGQSFDLDRLAASYIVSEDKFEVELPTGETLHFRTIGRKADKVAFYAAAATVWGSLPTDPKVQEIHPWKGHFPETQDEFFSAFKISELSIEPTKIPMLVALKLLKAPEFYEFVESRIDEACKTISSIAFAERVNEAKKNLTRTLLSAPASESAPSASESTQTN